MKIELSGRTVTIAFQTLAVNGLGAAVVFTARSAESAAAAAANLVQNVDEPARNLYQQMVYISASCASDYQCTVTFSEVPSGKVLRITHASCYYTLSDTAGINLVEIVSGTPSAKADFISTVPQGSPYTVVANAGINLVPRPVASLLYTLPATLARFTAANARSRAISSLFEPGSTARAPSGSLWRPCARTLVH
jgi:hypothetical protein